MRISIAGGRRMDWDEVLYELPVVGRDFEVLLLVEGLEIFRGPMGSLERMADDLSVRPELLVRRWARSGTEFVTLPDEAGPLRFALTCHRALFLPDASVVVTDLSSVPVWRLCAPGDSILTSAAHGLGISE